MKKTIRSIRRLLVSLRPPFLSRNDLPAILAQANPAAPLPERVAWLEALFVWIASDTGVAHEFDESTGQLHWIRIKYLIHVVERNPEWKNTFGATLRSILEDCSAVELFCRTGLVQEGGLISELVDRILKMVLPAPPRDGDLDDVFPLLFGSMNDAVWVENLPDEISRHFIELVEQGTQGHSYTRLRQSLCDALLVLGQEVAARGVSPEVRLRLPFPSVNQSPFLKLRKRVEKIVSEATSGQSIDLYEWEEDIESALGAITRIYQHLSSEGVSVHLVYAMECQRSSIRRIRMMTRILVTSDRTLRNREMKRFLGVLIRESLASRQVRPLISNNLRLLSQKIVERAGDTGEHYIMRTKAGYLKMFWSGVGGGLVTVFTTLLKFQTSFANLPLFFEGFFVALNYSSSFILMQLSGFTLATKQPAVTGPTIAGKLRELRTGKHIQSFVDEIASLTRSQFIAAIANVTATASASALLDYFYFLATGSHVLTKEQAQYVVHSFDPFHTLTVFYAAWTGVILWSAGIAAGWVENWVVCRKIPQAITLNRNLNKVFSRSALEKTSDFFLHNIGGVAGSTVLGFLMAFTPIVGKFFGFPFEVRHVTLSAAGVAFAAGALFSPEMDYVPFLYATLGIASMFVLNLGVSFSLAFFIAARARQVPSRSIALLIRKTLRTLRKHPMRFFYPVSS